MVNSQTDFKYFIKKLGKDTLIYVPAKLIPGTITIISVAIFTRIFNPSDYGQYILVFTTTTCLTAIFSQWITQSTLRYRSQYVLKGKLLAFNRNLFRILLLLSIALCFLATVLYPFRNILGSYQRFYIISTFIIISGIWFNNLLSVYQADLKSSTFSSYTIVNAILKFICAIVLIFLILKDIIFLLWGIFFAFSVVVIFMIIAVKNNGYEIEPSQNKDNNGVESFSNFSKQFFIYGFPMMGWFLGHQLLSLSDRYFLQVFRGSEDVGIYGSNYNLVASAILFVAMPLLTAAHPLLMKAGIDVFRKEEIQKLITIFSRYFLVIAVPIAIYVMILSKEIADIFLGVEYRQGNVVLPIVFLGLATWYFAMFGHKGLEFREKTNIMFVYVMLCSALKIILNILFIPRYGYIAAAVTTLISFSMYPILVYFGTKSDIRWNIPWVSFVKILIASTVLAISFIFLKTLHLKSILTLTISGIITIPMYLSMLYLLGEIKSYEIKYARKFLKDKMGLNRTV